jgi:phage shock protein A
MPDEEPTPETTAPAESKVAVPVPAPPHADPDPGYDSAGVPTFEFVREKIETRYGTALGATELDSESPEGRQIEEQYEERQHAAAERLAQIRESMRSEES